RARTGLDNVVLSGGVALNSVCNGKILSRTGFKDVWIQPAAGDAGSSLGAALYLHHAVLGAPRAAGRPDAFSPRLGPAFSSAEIGAFLRGRGIVHRRLASREAVVAETARLIADGKVVG